MNNYTVIVSMTIPVKAKDEISAMDKIDLKYKKYDPIIVNVLDKDGNIII